MIHPYSLARLVLPVPFLCLLIAVLSLASCQPDHDPPADSEQYPILFKYQQLYFQPSKAYVLTATSFQELPAGTYSAEPYLEAELDIADWEFEIEQVELLDSNRLRLYFFPALDIMPADTVVSYKKVGADGIEINDPGIPPYRFRWDKANKTLHFDLQTVQYAKVDAISGDTDYSPFQIGEGISDNGNPGALIEQQRTTGHLQPGDTVLLNHSGWLYPEQ